MRFARFPQLAYMSGPLHLPCFDASRAYSDSFDLAVHDRGHFLDVRLEDAVGHAMRMADAASSGRVFAADRAYLGHMGHSVLSAKDAPAPPRTSLHMIAEKRADTNTRT